MFVEFVEFIRQICCWDFGLVGGYSWLREFGQWSGRMDVGFSYCSALHLGSGVLGCLGFTL